VVVPVGAAVAVVVLVVADTFADREDFVSVDYRPF
jgi:hypothetical protein